jgi:hypothetical protein
MAPFGKGRETLPIEAWSLHPCLRRPMACRTVRRVRKGIPSPKIDSGEGFASEDAPPSSADADFLRIPGRTGQLSLVSSFARPIACPHSPPRRELTQRFQGSWPQPYASPPLRRPRLPEAATLGARRLAGDLPAAVSQSTNPIVTLQWRNVKAPWEPPASGRVEVLRH